MNTGRPVTVSFNPTIRAPRDSRSQREERYWLVSGQYIPDADSNVIFNHVLRTMGGVPNGVRFVLEGEEGYAELHIHGIIELIPDEDVVVILNESLPRSETTDEYGEIVEIRHGLREIVTNDQTDGYIIERATEEEIQILSENGTHPVFRGDDLRSLRDEESSFVDEDYVRSNLSFLTSSENVISQI